MGSQIRLQVAFFLVALSAIAFGPASSASAEQASSALFPVQAASLDLGQEHTCVIMESRWVRCWGAGDSGRLGYGNTESLGDKTDPYYVEPMPGSPHYVPPVFLPGPATAVSAGTAHTCAIYNDSALGDGRVLCWGNGGSGRLGYGNEDDVGDNEHPGSLEPVRLGGAAAAIAAGERHTCALLTTGQVRCWGSNHDGRLGYGNATTIGNDEYPDESEPVRLGGPAKAIVAGSSHTCALLASGQVRCWGEGGSGQLGVGFSAWIGDDEHPDEVEPVRLGGEAVALAAGSAHTCALLGGGQVRCWGYGGGGRLGYGNEESVGVGEHPDEVEPVRLGGPAIAVAAGGSFTCALLATGQVRCWGYGGFGELGTGESSRVGDNELPNEIEPVRLGGVAVAIATGSSHACALLASGQLRCWGNGNDGQLGYGNIQSIGDDEYPESAGSVQLDGTLIRSAGDLSLNVDASPISRTTGDSGAVTATLTNSGPNAQPGVRVRISVPPILGIAGATPTVGTFSGDIWSIPALPAGASATLTLSTTAVAEGSARVSGEVIAATLPDPDSTPANADPAEDDLSFTDPVIVSADRALGPVGPGGPPGRRGPAGRDAKVTCRIVQPKGKQRVRCTVTIRARGVFRAALRRGGQTIDRARVREGHLRIVAAPGRYSLLLVYRDGHVTHTSIQLR